MINETRRAAFPTRGFPQSFPRTLPEAERVYHRIEMRRGLSISLILLFWLGPLAVTLPASAESRLPACCRRHGAHHCAMSAEAISNLLSRSGPAFSAPSHCPYYPGGMTASVTTPLALIAAAAVVPAMRNQLRFSDSRLTDACQGQIRSRAGRGPPASLLS